MDKLKQDIKVILDFYDYLYGEEMIGCPMEMLEDDHIKAVLFDFVMDVMQERTEDIEKALKKKNKGKK